MKLLEYLLANNLTVDERTARGLIMRGDVLVNERPVTSAHAGVPADAAVRLRTKGIKADVSRGALKIRPAMEQTGFDCRDAVALDLGVSTGGFTQVLLEQGARLVYAVDVAYGTIAVELRNDPRVVLLERTNARELTGDQLPQSPSRIVGDLSFISWGAVLPAVVPLVSAAAELLLLVKPQFELAAMGREAELSAGIVQSVASVEDCLANLYNMWSRHGLDPVQVVPAGVRGAKGNQEYFVYLKNGPVHTGADEYIELVRQAIGEAQS